MATMLRFLNFSILIICVGLCTEAGAVERKDSAAVIKRIKRQLAESEMTYDIRRAFMDKINGLRRNVYPRAKDMTFLTWDNQYERAMQRIAATCKTENSGEDSAKMTKAMLDGTTADLVTALDKWFEEGNDYDFDNNKCNAATGTCDNYKQIMCSYASKVGCSLARCPQDNPTSTLVVCEYNVYLGSNQPYTKVKYNCAVGQEINSLCVSPKSCAGLSCSEPDTLEEYCLCKPPTPVTTTAAPTTKDNPTTIEDNGPPTTTQENPTTVEDNSPATTTQDNPTTVEDNGRATTEARCGSKTCENGEMLDEECECYCPEGKTCDTEDGRRNGAVRTRLQSAMLALAVCVFVSFA